jgi:hypothetical protein
VASTVAPLASSFLLIEFTSRQPRNKGVLGRGQDHVSQSLLLRDLMCTPEDDTTYRVICACTGSAAASNHPRLTRTKKFSKALTSARSFRRHSISSFTCSSRYRPAREQHAIKRAPQQLFIHLSIQTKLSIQTHLVDPDHGILRWPPPPRALDRRFVYLSTGLIADWSSSAATDFTGRLTSTSIFKSGNLAVTLSITRDVARDSIRSLTNSPSKFVTGSSASHFAAAS